MIVLLISEQMELLKSLTVLMLERCVAAVIKQAGTRMYTMLTSIAKLPKKNARAPKNKNSVLPLCAVAFSGFVLLLLTLCFVPPIRDQFFSTNLWPWALPSDVTEQQLNKLQSLSQPGDVIVETNMHSWQWVSLCLVFTGSTWVHASLVDANGNLLTVSGKVEELPISVYFKWRSTRIALVRPAYTDQQHVWRALAYGSSKLGTPYDPSFKDPNASCTGIVAESLRQGGIDVPSRAILGRKIYAANSFLGLPGARLIWTSDGKSPR